MSDLRGSILAVDDEVLNRDLLTRRLSADGYVVACAASGLECLEQLRIERYDMVLLDINMPDLDGYDTLREIRACTATCDVPVIILSAVCDRNSIVRCLELGANDCLAKPFNWADMKSRIARVMQVTAAARGLPLPEKRAENASILIVDDEKLNRDLLAHRIRALGHLPVCAAGGGEALRLLASTRLDLVLLDIMMPGCDGAAVLADIRSRPETRDLPVLMVSALDDSDTMTRFIELGADDFVMKPYNPALLGRRVATCLAAAEIRGRQRVREQRLRELAEIGRLIAQGLDPGNADG